jgi:hypothetical protein
MRQLRFFDKNNNAIKIGGLLDEYVEQAGPAVTLEDQLRNLIQKINAGELRVDPSPIAIRDAMLLQVITEWTSESTYGTVGRFFSDRQGGRFDRRSGQVAKIAAYERTLYAESCRQYLLVQSPAAIRSQMALLTELEPNLKVGALRDQILDRFADAIDEGVELGRKAREQPPD